MEKILAKLPEHERGFVQRVLDLINSTESGFARRIFCSRLAGIADMLLAEGFITTDEYIVMVKVR